MNRVLNPSKYLLNIVENNKTFYVGFGIQDLSNLGKGHPGIKDLISGSKTSLLVIGKKGILKENTKGKFVRKQPEQKETIWKHIHYYSERFGKEIDFDREFHVWEKTLLHNYNLELEAAKTPQGEVILHFPSFTMKESEETYLKVGAAMNMSIALGSYYLIYDAHFEPIVPVTKFENKRILSAGNHSVAEKLEIIKNELLTQGNNEASKGNSYRFALLKEKSPVDVTMGLGGFNEYLMFEYPEDDLMVLENLKSGNATYLFTLSKFNKNNVLNKQNASSDPSFLKRIIHNNLDDWNKKFREFFKN
jgi:hypothetical protein